MTGSPFIKEETDEFSFNPNKFVSANGMSMSQQFNSHFATSGAEMNGVDPANINMTNFGANMPNSYTMGSAGIPDDELHDLLLEDQNGFPNFEPSFSDNAQANHGGFMQGQGQAISMSHPSNGIQNQAFSHTPDMGSIPGPYANDANFAQYRAMQGFHSIPMQNGMHRKMHGMERNHSDTRSPMTPKTPALGSLHISTPDSSQLSAQALLNQHLHQHARAASSQWDGTPGSGHSYLDSPLPSPHGNQMHHAQISELMASGKQMSLPTKVENTHNAIPAFQSQEAKKKRRRESHNLVERRRRDNINERIQDLSRLVPNHRLDDEKIRKLISTNGPLSPAGISPPQATSLLAGGAGRRATAGNITQGLPIEEKDRGPNKGDILNGAVGWMRDLMWRCYEMEKQQEKLKKYIEDLGGSWPFEKSEEERRMESELIDTVEQNGPNNFHYSRAPGSGLRVPKHTNYAGEPVDEATAQQEAGVSQNATSGAAPQASAFWASPNQNGGDSGRGSMSLKEEEEYMDMA